MADPFRRPYAGSDPGVSAFAITPHATDEVNPIPRALYVGVAGNLTVRLMNDSADVLFVGVPAGTVLPIRPQYVRASGTTAGSLVGLL